MLSTDSPRKKDDMVSGRVYDFSDNFWYHLSLWMTNIQPRYRFLRMPLIELGDVIEAKVTDVKADGKLDLTMREKLYSDGFRR